MSASGQVSAKPPGFCAVGGGQPAAGAAVLVAVLRLSQPSRVFPGLCPEPQAAPRPLCTRHRSLLLSPRAILVCSDGKPERDSRGAAAGLPKPLGGAWGMAGHAVTVLKSSLEVWGVFVCGGGHTDTPSPSFCHLEGPDHGGGLPLNEPLDAAGSTQSSAGGTSSSTGLTDQDEAFRLR